MEPNNTDKQIKNLLEKREITPSLKSWEELRSRLDASEKKKTPLYWYLALAASFVAGILIVSLLFNTKTSNDNPVVFEEQILKTTELQNEIPVFDSLGKVTQISNSKVPNVIEEVSVKEIEANNKPETKPDENPATDSAVAENIPEEESVVLYKKVEDVIAQVSSEETEQDFMRASEIDVLLAKATAEILKEKQKYLYKSQGFVSASDLLNDVEYEMEQSFREKIFEMLKEGFNKSRTAVANRNQ